MTNNGACRVVIDIEGSPNILSPMASLAVNLSGTTLSVTPKLRIPGRRLSMSSITPDTPVGSSMLSDFPEGKNFDFCLKKKTVFCCGF